MKLLISLLSAVLLLAFGALFFEAQPKVVTENPVTKKVETPVAKKTTDEDAPQSWTLIAGGDVMLGRGVDLAITNYGGVHPFKNVAQVMKSADFTMVNLESPFLINGSRTVKGSLILRGNPEGVKGLVEAGVDFASLANNHITDMRLQGIKDTKGILKKNNILYAGGGESQAEAKKAAIFPVKEIKLGLLSYTYGVNFNSTGVYYNLLNTKTVISDVVALKKQVDLVIVSVHFGAEYAAQPNTTQKTFARSAIDAGASLVIGHHPHVPQPVEKYKNGVIIYSLGNLVFDQQEIGNRNFSALAKFTFEDKKLKKLELLPYQIFNRNQPKLIENIAQKERVWNLFGLAGGVLKF